MKSKYVYFAIAALAVAAVVYPVAYAQIANPNVSADPFLCAPLIPCQKPPPGSVLCTSICYIYMQDSNFVPGTVNVTVGATVVWINQDGFSHTSTSYNVSGWNSGAIPPGDRYSLTITSNFTVGASYYYHCNIHTTMIGLLNVVPS